MTTNVLTLDVASGESLDVRRFSVEEGLSRLFDVTLEVVSSSADVDFEGCVGGAARFEIHRTSAVEEDTRYWNGICVRAEQVRTEDHGLSTYMIRVVPTMWLLTQRRNYRVFQDKSELDIVLEILAEWGIDPKLELDAGSYTKRRMRIQYAESDFDFVNRLLEDIGVTYHFDQKEGETQTVLVDSPNRRSPRDAVRFVDQPNDRISFDYVTAVTTYREIRPGRYTQSDVDYRKALSYPLAASSTRGNAIESKLERYHHNYGSFLWKGGQGGGTPHADDRGAARTNEKDGAKQVEKRLEAQRVDARVVSFRTSAHDLRPGKVFTIAEHPRAELRAPLLVVTSRFMGEAAGDWTHTLEARYADINYRPPLNTAKPRTLGVESATVTGPGGEEIHTDEFGRVRVKFHWDREGASDETSSCWIPVSQAWAGAGFGAISLPRVGQEVLIDFLGADPDRPIVMGRVFTTTTPPPYELPKYKMVSGMRSESYPRPKAAAPQARMGGGPAAVLDAEPPPEPEVWRSAVPNRPAVTMGSSSGQSTTWAATWADHRPAVPAGGGVPLTALGGGEPGAVTAPATATPAGQPGIFGGLQAPPTELYGAVSRMQSLGPDSRDQRRSANGLVMDDQAGNERVYLQSQNDLFLTVKRNFTASVGANRAFMIMGNDYEEIPRGYQATKVAKDRTVEVNQKQTHIVIDDIVVDGKKNHIVKTKENFYSETTDGGQIYQAKTGIMLRVGTTSTILMTPTAIVIDAPKVYINPGPEVMSAIFSGQTPEQAAANKAREDRINAAASSLAEFMRSRGMTNNPVSRGGLNDAATNGPNGSGFRNYLSGQGLTDPAEISAAAQRTDQMLGPMTNPNRFGR